MTLAGLATREKPCRIEEPVNPSSPSRPKNAFEFVTVAAARARQLLEGCTPKVEGSDKPARRAVQEVANGRVARAEPDAE
jgi:DNA-directed RNA polymerase subunit K/omega